MNPVHENETILLNVKFDDPRKKEEEFVHQFVTSFLHPYISGQITRASEDHSRKPLIEQLLEQTKDFTLTKENIERIAFKTFFEKAALGAYVNRRRFDFNERNPRWVGVEKITSESDEFDILLYALNESLPKEVPHIAISEEILKIKAIEAVNNVTEERKRIEKEAFTFCAEGNILDKNIKDAILKKQKPKLFIK